MLAAKNMHYTFTVNEKAFFTKISSDLPELLDYTVDDLMGKPFTSLLTPEEYDAPQYPQYAFYPFLRSVKIPIKLKVTKKTGEIIPVVLHSTLVRTWDGTITGATASIKPTHAINPSWHVAEQSWHSPDILCHILNYAGDAIILSDDHSNIRFINEKALRLLQYKRAELLNHHITAIFPVAGIYLDATGGTITIDKRYLDNMHDKTTMLYTNGDLTTEMYVKREDNSIIPVKTTVSIIQDSRGTMTGSIIILREIVDTHSAKRGEHCHHSHANRLMIAHSHSSPPRTGAAVRQKNAGSGKGNIIPLTQETNANIKTETVFVPICASCKKIRNVRGEWDHVETYIKNHLEVELTHGICPECAKIYYSDRY